MQIGGSMVAIIMDRAEITWKDKFKLFVLQAIDEYGHTAWSAFKDVDILRYTTAVSIDDITMDQSIEFGADDYFEWQEGVAVRREELYGGLRSLSLTDSAEEVLGLKGQEHGITILKGWGEKYQQFKDEARRRAQKIAGEPDAQPS